MQPRVAYHTGTCAQCKREGDVLTTDANPLPLSLCLSRLPSLIGSATGIRSAILVRWPAMNRQTSTQQRQRRAELERKARADLERVAKLDKGNGWGV